MSVTKSAQLLPEKAADGWYSYPDHCQILPFKIGRKKFWRACDKNQIDLCEFSAPAGKDVPILFATAKQAARGLAAGGQGPCSMKGWTVSSKEAPISTIPAIPGYEVLRMVRKSLQFPYSKVCIHSVACDLLSLLEKHGWAIPDGLADAVVRCHDDVAIGFLDAELARLEKAGG